LDYYNSLCSVRLNGSGMTELVRKFYEVLCVSRDRIYYTAVDSSPKGDVDSICSINFDGSMSQKHHYDVQDAKACFSEKIYFTQKVESRSINELFADIDEPKIKKPLQKVYKAYSKKNVERTHWFNALNTFDCNTKQTEEIATTHWYPSITDLVEMGSGPAVKKFIADNR